MCLTLVYTEIPNTTSQSGQDGHWSGADTGFSEGGGGGVMATRGGGG